MFVARRAQLAALLLIDALMADIYRTPKDVIDKPVRAIK